MNCGEIDKTILLYRSKKISHTRFLKEILKSNKNSNNF
jgi:hypothetical protein